MAIDENARKRHGWCAEEGLPPGSIINYLCTKAPGHRDDHRSADPNTGKLNCQPWANESKPASEPECHLECNGCGYRGVADGPIGHAFRHNVPGCGGMVRVVAGKCANGKATLIAGPMPPRPGETMAKTKLDGDVCGPYTAVNSDNGGSKTTNGGPLSFGTGEDTTVDVVKTGHAGECGIAGDGHPRTYAFGKPTPAIIALHARAMFDVDNLAKALENAENRYDRIESVLTVMWVLADSRPWLKRAELVLDRIEKARSK